MIHKYWIFLLPSCSLFAVSTFTVTDGTDSLPGTNGKSNDLRYFLNQMNDELNAGSFKDYAINFDSSITTIQLNGILPIINNSSYPVNITIGNPDPNHIVTLDGNNGDFSGFFIPTGNVIIQNMIFQNMTAKGGTGGDGISGGGGGMGAGGAIYVPFSFLQGSSPSVTLINVAIDNCSAVGGDGGNYFQSGSPTGYEGGGGGGGFSGNGGSVTAFGRTGGGGGGGFGGNGGDATISVDNPDYPGGGGGGGGGIGSRATMGALENLGNGGSDQNPGQDGNGYGISLTGGDGAGGLTGGTRAGGGGGGAAIAGSGGGGGGSRGGTSGMTAEGSSAPGGSIIPSGGTGMDGGGGGGAGVVLHGTTNLIDGQAGSGGYGGGGGGGAGVGFLDTNYTLKGGSGGLGGGGGGGGSSDILNTDGGNSSGGGGGGGGGPGDGVGGSDQDNLGGGRGGNGGSSSGGGGGGGSGLGGAIFIDHDLEFTIQALPGVPTTFNTTNTTVQAGNGGLGGAGSENGYSGSAPSEAHSIFLRSGSTLYLVASDTGDLLTLGEGVSFTDDVSFDKGGTFVSVEGNGTVVYNGTSNYEGVVRVYSADFKVHGQINNAEISVCRNTDLNQRGTLSGTGTLTGHVSVNSGTLSPDPGGTLTLGRLSLSSVTPSVLLGSLVHITIDSSGSSLVSVNNSAALAGILEIDIDPNTPTGTSYTVLSATGGITGVFDSIAFTGTTPNYALSYLPLESPTFVQFDFLGYAPPPSCLPHAFNARPLRQ